MTMTTSSLNRRQFFAGTAAGLVVMKSASDAADRPAGKMRKAACIGVFPRDIPVLEKFRMAKRAGFEGIEPNTLYTQAEVDEYRKAAESTGIKIHSIMNSDHWRYPLTDNDPEVVKKCVEGIRTSLQNAHALGADAVLLVPGIVTPDVRYAQVYERSQQQIKELLGFAQDLGVVIAIENVSNRFLLSPLEFARYVEEFKSPWVKAYFDIGNLGSSGYPQDWIRTVGPQLLKVHIKRFEPGVDHPKFDPKDRRTQGIDWAAVRQALADVNYQGWITAEVRSGDEAYVTEVSRRMDRFLAGESPV
ncbi:MAG TPA: sugar phosphate isomerase/epimerase family protein [Acidobacteriota bacterium]|jgi:hexulose-6-phosphate isomerase|nr:sugar phosphate isomerase/epimerase family protein [Acidobacteriota bacterium]